MFEGKSRYRKAVQYRQKDRRGNNVLVVAVPEAPIQYKAGDHLRKQGQRIDHLAAQYTGDQAGFWRIAEINDAMLPEALSEKNEIAIPRK